MKSTHSFNRYLLSTTLDARQIPVDKYQWQEYMTGIGITRTQKKVSHPTREDQEENSGRSHKDNERMVEEGSPAGKESVHGAEAPVNSSTKGHSTLLTWNI